MGRSQSASASSLDSQKPDLGQPPSLRARLAVPKGVPMFNLTPQASGGVMELPRAKPTPMLVDKTHLRSILIRLRSCNRLRGPKLVTTLLNLQCAEGMIETRQYVSAILGQGAIKFGNTTLAQTEPSGLLSYSQGCRRHHEQPWVMVFICNRGIP